MSATTVLTNPFARPVVDSPRDVLTTAESIHRAEFESLLQRFNAYNALRAPRLRAGPLVLRVLSQVPGSGKSHLLGRLWRGLEGRATTIYLRAHQDRFGFWRRILERLVQELEYPEGNAGSSAEFGPATRLDALARNLLAELMERMEAGARSRGAGSVGTRLRRAWSRMRLPLVDGGDSEARLVRNGEPAALVRLRGELPEWLQQFGLELRSRLASAGISLHRRPESWLQVLATYTLNDSASEARALALSWLQGGQFDAEEARLLGLSERQANAGVSTDAQEETRNEEAFCCIRDLCALGAFFQPFVFAFDQTEIYGQTAELAGTFGATLGRLQAECVNQLTLVTGNQGPWEERVWKHFELADRDRFDGGALTIRGIGREQARELLQVKLRRAGYADASIESFVQQAWFEELFASQVERKVPRAVEQAAGIALQRWQQSQPPSADPVNPAAGRLYEAFEEHRRRLLATPKATDFDVAVLQWLLSEGLAGLPGIHVERSYRSPKGYLTARWEFGDQTWLFALSNSAVWNRWQAIVREYQQQSEAERERGREPRGIALWHRSLKPIGAGMRRQLEVPAAQGFRIVQLSDEDAAELYAGQAVFADLCEGNLEQVDGEGLVEFLGRRLSPWVARFEAELREARLLA